MASHSDKYLHCKEQLIVACKAVNNLFPEVQMLLRHKQVFVYDDTEQEKALKVKFETATLHFLFDEDQRCDSVFLLLDDTVDIQDYIKYCVSMYHYDYILQGWITNDCFIQIYTEKGKSHLLVSVKKPVSI